MIKSFLFLYILFFPAYLFSFSNLTIEGTGDSQELLKAIAGSFEKKYLNTSVTIPKSVGSSGGIKKLIANKCSLARVAREITAEEKDKGLNSVIFGYSPIVFVINGNIKNRVLSEKNIIQIFKGEIKNWEQLPLTGLEGKIYVVSREETDSSRKVLNKKLPGFSNIKKFSGATALFNQEAVQMISEHKNTIGYLAIGNIRGSDLKVVKLNGYEPTLKNIKNKKYRLITPLGLVYKGELDELSKKFLNYLKTDESKKLMNNFGIIPAN